jgi:hypothetical protein
VIAHGCFRATRDSDLLVPDGPEAVSAIYGGASEIQRTIVAKTLGLQQRYCSAQPRASARGFSL